jgi:3',5'-cyclic-AMP phosphodiesterase
VVLSGHTYRVTAGILAGIPVWISPATGSQADVLARNGFRGHTGGGFTRVDVLDDGEFVATFVPLTGRDEILYEVIVDEADRRPAV